MRTNETVNINQLLSSIPQQEYKLLFANLEHISLKLGQVIYKIHQEIEYVYFPLYSMISLVSVLNDKSTTEIGLIGNEGLVGLTVFLGSNQASNLTIVQIPDGAMRVKSEIFKAESQKPGELNRLLLLYIQARLTQISQNAVCKCHHQIEQQFAGWLLYAHDSVKNDNLPLTQKFIAQMLGVRRATVTEIAQKFQKAQIIFYTRGNIVILDREALELSSCECYFYVKREFDRLLKFH